MKRISLLIALLSAPALAESGKFYSTVNAPEISQPVGHEGGWSLGFFTNASVPLSNPFSATLPAGTPIPVRYQVPIGLGLELGYGLSTSWELGLAVGYESFETVDEVNPSNLNQNQKITLRDIPVGVNARYLMPGHNWRGEIEGGLGLGFASVVASEKDNLSGAEFSGRATRLRGHVAFGAAFPWAEDFSVHVQAGVNVATLSSKTYALPNGTISQTNSFGVFTKAEIRYQF